MNTSRVAEGVPIPDAEMTTKRRKQQAIAAGNPTYIPLEFCVHGHKLRYVKTGACVECSRNRGKRNGEV